MAESDIIQGMISRPGQSQADRLPPELQPEFFAIDDRSIETLLSQAAALAQHIRFSPDDGSEISDWTTFFPANDDQIQTLLSCPTADVPPHLALYISFLRLYQQFPQRAINALTGRHLNFQFQQVLQFKHRPAQPDRAHVLIELKKGTAPLVITPQHRFTAGKDAQGIQLIYQPVRDVVINHGQVAELKSIFRDSTRLRFAPQADSTDGLGGKLDPVEPKWHAFGHSGMPEAQIGFAFASPVLRMAEGTRTIRVSMQLGGLNSVRHHAEAFGNSFTSYVTGPKGWMKAESVSSSVVANQLTLAVVFSSAYSAIIDCDPKVHGQAFDTHHPLLQFVFNQTSALRYQDLSGLTVGELQMSVDVDSLTALNVENDFGTLNPKRPFQPFGPQPIAGSRFMIGCPEALSKRLNDLRLIIQWQGAPPSLASWYQHYTRRSLVSDGVRARLTYQDRSGQPRLGEIELIGEGSTDESAFSILVPPPTPVPLENPTDVHLFSLMSANSGVARDAGRRLTMRLPIHARSTIPAPPLRSGFITLVLLQDLLHADYRREILANARLTPAAQVVLNEPYTPTIQSIQLQYAASSDSVDVSANDETSFTNLDLQFFHVGCFGQMREHAFLRHRATFLHDKRVTLLPAYPDAGELLIGVRGVSENDGLSLLLQVVQDSAEPDLPQHPLTWSVLCDNYWRPLTAEELALDTSFGLRTSGILAVALPTEVTSQNSILPPGLVWLRASIASDPASVCQLLRIANNAVEVQLVTTAEAPTHLSSGLPAGQIVKLQSPPTAVKAIEQPYASFDGRQQETDQALVRRAAERLRHRNRCISAWDYERMVLEAFPALHRVKCVPHANSRSWLAPGHLLLVVIPDLRSQDSTDRLRPRADARTLSQVAEFVQRQCGSQVRVSVKNPFYQQVRLALKVRFRSGLPFNSYSRSLNDALVHALTPWAFDMTTPIEFAGQIDRSVLLHWVEELPYVDFVSDFQLFSPDSNTASQDVARVRASAPDAILVSDHSHAIAEFTEA